MDLLLPVNNAIVIYTQLPVYWVHLAKMKAGSVINVTLMKVIMFTVCFREALIQMYGHFVV